MSQLTSMQCLVFICFFKLPPITLSRVITATMLFLQFVLYWSSFVGILKNEIPGAALELWQLQIKQFSPGIFKFSTKHKDNPLIFKLFGSLPRFFIYISCRLAWQQKKKINKQYENW